VNTGDRKKYREAEAVASGFSDRDIATTPRPRYVTTARIGAVTRREGPADRHADLPPHH
jgi:hypothetical protein